MAVSDGDVVLVPKGHHPCAAPYGFEMYYLNIMAGPLRKWRFLPDPAVERILEQDSWHLFILYQFLINYTLPEVIFKTIDIQIYRLLVEVAHQNNK